MTGHRQFLALLGLSGAFATATPNITWGPCSEFPGAKLPVQCANLTVPLDYTRPAANETLTLNLVRLPALKKSKGSILLNFGGPGIPGRPSLAGGGETYQAFVLRLPRGPNRIQLTSLATLTGSRAASTTSSVGIRAAPPTR